MKEVRARARKTLPLVAFGSEEGIFAFGNIATGIFAFGNVARGVFAFGNVAMGSVLAVGNVAVGTFAFGNVAIGPVSAIGASLAFGGVIGRALAVGFGAASQTTTDALGLPLHFGTSVPLPLGVLFAPIAWMIMTRVLTPDRPVFSLKRSPEPIAPPIDRRALPSTLVGHVVEFDEGHDGTFSLALKVRGSGRFDLHGKDLVLPKIGERVRADVIEETVETPATDYRAAPEITKRIVVTSFAEEPREPTSVRETLALWYARAVVMAVVASVVATYVMIRG